MNTENLVILFLCCYVSIDYPCQSYRVHQLSLHLCFCECLIPTQCLRHLILLNSSSSTLLPFGYPCPSPAASCDTGCPGGGASSGGPAGGGASIGGLSSGGGPPSGPSCIPTGRSSIMNTSLLVSSVVSSEIPPGVSTDSIPVLRLINSIAIIKSTKSSEGTMKTTLPIP